MSTTEITHHTIAVKDIRMHYARAGAGDPVVLLHGWPQTGAAWSRVIPALAERHEVIVPDLRGMGATSKAPGGYDLDNVADDVHELVRLLGHSQVLLAGHDWGAVAAYSYAAQHRDEVRALAIFEMVLPGFGLMEGAMTPAPHGQFLWHMGFQSVGDIAVSLIEGREDLYLGHMFNLYAYDQAAVAPERMGTYVEALRQVGALQASMGYYTEFFTTAEQNRRHAERKLEMPVLAMGGEASLGPLTKQCLELAAHDVQGGVIERCGHWIGEERPDFIAEALLAFFAATRGVGDGSQE